MSIKQMNSWDVHRILDDSGEFVRPAEITLEKMAASSSIDELKEDIKKLKNYNLHQRKIAARRNWVSQTPNLMGKRHK